jgi:hypothetical protein
LPQDIDATKEYTAARTSPLRNAFEERSRPDLEYQGEQHDFGRAPTRPAAAAQTFAQVYDRHFPTVSSTCGLTETPKVQTAAREYARVLATLSHTSSPTGLRKAQAETNQQAPTMAHLSREHDAERKDSSCWVTLDWAQQSQSLSDIGTGEHVSATISPLPATMTGHVSDLGSQRWHEPVLPSGTYVAPFRPSQTHFEIEPPAKLPQELNDTSRFLAAQAADSAKTVVNERRRVDSDTIADWRDEPDPEERRRLESGYHQRGYRDRERAAEVYYRQRAAEFDRQRAAEYDRQRAAGFYKQRAAEFNAWNQARTNGALETQRLAQSQVGSEPLGHSEDETRGGDSNSVLDQSNEPVSEVVRIRQRRTITQRQRRQRQRAEIDALNKTTTGIAPELQRLLQPEIKSESSAKSQDENRGVEVETPPDWSKDPNPIERRRLQNLFHQRKLRKRGRDEIDAPRQATKGIAPAMERLSYPDIPELSARLQEDDDHDLDPVARRRLANTLYNRQWRWKQKAEYEALSQAKRNLASGVHQVPQSHLVSEPVMQSQDELNFAPGSRTAQVATLTKRQAKEREHADPNEVPSRPNGLDPEQRRRLQASLNTQQRQTRRRAEVEVPDHASMDISLGLQQARYTPQERPQFVQKHRVLQPAPKKS